MAELVSEVLAGMPEPAVLHRVDSDGQTAIMQGSRVLFCYDSADAGMRNLAVVAVTDAGVACRRAAEVFDLTPQYVSMLRGRGHTEGSAGLARRRGRPPKLSGRQIGRARLWAGQNVSQTEIAARLGVARSVISELVARYGPIPSQDELTIATPTGGDDDESPAVAEGTGSVAAEEAADKAVVDEATGAAVAQASTASARIEAGGYVSRYGGAMLLYPYLHRVGAETTFASLTAVPARRYDDLAVLTTATLGFALGAGTMEGFKHLRRAELGPIAGLSTVPELASLRARLAALADGSDPLALQRGFAAGMLAADPAPDPVYFVDDHFVPYAGARPVAKGWNTKRRHAQPGRDDTLLVDARGRAVVFGSGEPTSLASTLPGVLTQLRAVIGADAPILLGFDRGGAFPVAFTACRDAGADWITYRRAPLVTPAAAPETSTTVRDGHQISVQMADETVTIKGYGTARQLTLFEHDTAVLQVLTSEETGNGADLLCWLRARWRIENMFKYAAAHNGIDTLADYGMGIDTDTRKVTNPARVTARKNVKTAETELADAERALAQLLAADTTVEQKNKDLPAAHQRVETATTAVTAAKTAMKPIPAKVPATDLDPDAKLAHPHLQRRGLQMVLRLLAFNAEAWLADHLNAYLTDPDEYRAITRNLLHLGGRIDYGPHQISIILDRPDSPRVARALKLLTQELNNTPTRLPGDRRSLRYQLSET